MPLHTQVSSPDFGSQTLSKVGSQLSPKTNFPLNFVRFAAELIQTWHCPGCPDPPWKTGKQDTDFTSIKSILSKKSAVVVCMCLCIYGSVLKIGNCLDFLQKRLFYLFNEIYIYIVYGPSCSFVSNTDI